MASIKHKDGFLKALLHEIEMQKHYTNGEEIETIYLGGGTPSLLTSNEINAIFDQLYKHFPVHPEAEITLEANPDDLDHTFLDQLQKTPVNRLSVGIQSFSDRDLKYLNRVHDARDAIASIQRAHDKGFQQFSVDLIYGTPTLNTKQWEDNLRIITELNITHLSAYSLTVEPKTILEIKIRKKLNEAVNDIQAVEHFNMLMDWAEENNWDHYEISNLCKPGHQSKHNTNYWRAKKYLGLGPSAHSFNILSRQWNTSNLKNYIDKLTANQLPFEKEILSQDQKYDEYILLGMRTQWGCDSSFIAKQFGQEYKSCFLNNLQPYLENRQVIQKETQFTLSHEGKLFADAISADLFFDIV